MSIETNAQLATPTQEKKTYSTPELTVHGDIRTFTTVLPGGNSRMIDV